MGRKKADPEIRKMDFIKAADELFREQGLDQTSIKDIASRVGVSHAAFFYYYKSKNDIFRDVVVYHLGQYERMAEKMMEDNSLSAIKKLQAVIDLTISQGVNDSTFLKYLHTEGNSAIHDKYVERQQEIFIPLITKIVEQGIREGTIDLDYPKETVECIIHVFECLDEVYFKPMDNDQYYRKMRAIETIISRTLRLKDNTLIFNIKR